MSRASGEKGGNLETQGKRQAAGPVSPAARTTGDPAVSSFVLGAVWMLRPALGTAHPDAGAGGQRPLQPTCCGGGRSCWGALTEG